LIWPVNRSATVLSEKMTCKNMRELKGFKDVILGSQKIIMKLPNNITPDEIAKTRDRFPHAFSRRLHYRILIIFGWGPFAALVIYTLVDFGFTFERIYYGLGKLGHVISFMFPPFLYEDLAGWTEILHAIAETVAMAFMGTLMASFASLFLGFLGAKNIMHYWPFHYIQVLISISINGLFVQ